MDGSTLHVDYAYDDYTDDTYRGIDDVFTKGMRPKSIKYPNSRLVHYTYGTGGGVADALSRVAVISGNADGTTAYAAYKRAGDGRIIEEAFAEPDLKLTHIGAGNKADAPWHGHLARESQGRPGRALANSHGRDARVTHGQDAHATHGRDAHATPAYDRNSNRRWRAERSSATTASGRDESYAYDRLNRLVGAKRGILPSGTYQAPYPGDVTGNGVVDGSDSSVITANLNNSSRRWASGDLDGNGLVNSDDSAIYAANAGTPTGSVAAGRAWTLDATGNWAAYKQDNNGDGYYTGAGDLDQARLHNKANEIYDATDAITEQSNPQQAAWADPVSDARGNMTKAPKPLAMTATYTCIYDAWNRLAEVQAGEVTIAKYRYDGLGRRVKSHIDSQAPASPDGVDAYRHFYYNAGHGLRSLGEAGWQMLETRKTTTETTAPDTLNPEYQYVWSQRYVDAPVLRDENKNSDGDCTDAEDERLYYCTDAQMNVTALVTAAGTVVERYAYDPYGQPIFYDGSWGSQSSSSHGNAILYGGYYRDAETGFYHVRNRMYHPLLGRWLTRDPIGYADGMSLYEYVGGSPLNAADPAGLWYNIRETVIENIRQPGPDGTLVYGTWTDTWEDWGHWYQGQWDAINAGQYKQTIKFTPYPVQPTTKVRPRVVRDSPLYDGAGDYLPSAVGINATGSGYSRTRLQGLGGQVGLNRHWDFANPENTGWYLTPGVGAGKPGPGASITGYVAWGTRYQPWYGQFFEFNYGRGGIVVTVFVSPGRRIVGIAIGIGIPGGSGNVTGYIPLPLTPTPTPTPTPAATTVKVKPPVTRTGQPYYPIPSDIHPDFDPGMVMPNIGPDIDPGMVMPNLGPDIDPGMIMHSWRPR